MLIIASSGNTKINLKKTQSPNGSFIFSTFKKQL